MKAKTYTKEEFIRYEGWSSKKFQEHSKMLFDLLPSETEIEIRRSFIIVRTNKTSIKFYVHHNGRTNDYMTLTDFKGTELRTFHCSTDPIHVCNVILSMLS